MSIADAAKLKHLGEQLQALQNAYVELSERVLTLEAERETPSFAVDTETGLPLIKKRGRPARVQA